MAARSIPGQTAPWPTSKFATKSVARALALGSRTSRLRRLDVVAVLVVFWHGNASLRKAAATRVQSQGGAVRSAGAALQNGPRQKCRAEVVERLGRDVSQAEAVACY